MLDEHNVLIGALVSNLIAQIADSRIGPSANLTEQPGGLTRGGTGGGDGVQSFKLLHSASHRLLGSRALLEISGGVTLDNVRGMAETGA